MWVVLGVITGVFLLITAYCEKYNWMEGQWGRLTGRSYKTGFFGSGNFLHGSMFEHNPIVKALANLIAPLWRKGFYEEIPDELITYPNREHPWDPKLVLD